MLTDELYEFRYQPSLTMSWPLERDLTAIANDDLCQLNEVHEHLSGFLAASFESLRVVASKFVHIHMLP